MNARDDRVMLTAKGADALRLVDEEAASATQWDEVAEARERRDAQRRADLALWNDGAVPDPWDERLAQRHRFDRQAAPDNGQTSGPPPFVPWVAVVLAAAGGVVMALALIWGAA